jgi:Caspase domain
MSRKIALLIGVSEYAFDLASLPHSIKDVESMKRILRDPHIGNFDRVDLLLNPELAPMQEKIEELFSDCSKDDLVLLFFSGHGIKDDKGDLYFANRFTRKMPNGGLAKSTAVPASFIHAVMNDSRSKRQVIVLDCCFSGAFPQGLQAKDDGRLDIQTQLSGSGRAILTSSTATQYSFEKEDLELSIYTHFLVEGLETGKADLDKDGDISIDELHEYVREQVKEVMPQMRPEFYPIKEGSKIVLARVNNNTAMLYRKEVERLINKGEINDIARMSLEARRKEYRLSAEDAEVIEYEVLKPHQEYQRALRDYEQIFFYKATFQYPLRREIRDELKSLQDTRKLKDEDVHFIEAKFVNQLRAGRGTAPPAIIQHSSDEHQQILSHTNDHALSTQITLPTSRRSGLGYRLLTGGGIIALSLGGAALLFWQRQQTQFSPLSGQFAELTGAAADRVIAETVYPLWLEEAKSLANQEQYPEAIRKAQQIPQSSPLFPEVQDNLSKWAEYIIQQIKAEMIAGSDVKAIQLIAEAIPSNVPEKQTAANLIQMYKNDSNWKTFRQAIQALAVMDWWGARKTADPIKTGDSLLLEGVNQIKKKAESKIQDIESRVDGCKQTGDDLQLYPEPSETPSKNEEVLLASEKFSYTNLSQPIVGAWIYIQSKSSSSESVNSGYVLKKDIENLPECDPASQSSPIPSEPVVSTPSPSPEDLRSKPENCRFVIGNFRNFCD